MLEYAKQMSNNNSWVNKMNQNQLFTLQQAYFNQQIVSQSEELEERLEAIETGQVAVKSIAETTMTKGGKTTNRQLLEESEEDEESSDPEELFMEEE